MFKKIGLIVCFLLSIVQGVEMPIDNPVLSQAFHRYIDFVNRVGQGDQFAYNEEAVTLFAPNCKKIFNGWVVTENRDDFVTDLVSVYKNNGSWKHDLLDVLHAPADQAVIFRSRIDTAHFGTNTAIVILRFDSDNLITEINEVFSPIKTAYEFNN